VPFAISQLQIFAFYAMPDTRTPALVNIPVVMLRVAVDVLLYLLLPATLVAAGLMAGNAVSFVLAAALGYWLMRARIGRLGLGRVVATIGRLGLAAGIAAVPTLLAFLALRAGWGEGKVASAVQLVVCGAVLVGGYLAAALALRVREVRELTSMARRR
jgi:putative peptidoglycan lipid II flippase